MNSAKKLAKLLSKKRVTVAVAESCTGGLLSNKLTNIPGSSKYFLLGIIAYSNNTKVSLLKIPEKIIKTQGAVSSAVAKLMAENIRNLAKSDIGIGITGIAGPTGATAQKPVGTVFICISYKNKSIVKEFLFRGSRLGIKRKTVDKTFEILKRFLN